MSFCVCCHCQRRNQNLLKDLIWSLLLKAITSFKKKFHLSYLGFDFFVSKNKLNIYKCQFRYKGRSKRSKLCIQLRQLKQVFFTSLNKWSPKRSTFEILESSLLKIFSSILWSFLNSVNLINWKIWTMKKVVNICLTVSQLLIGFNIILEAMLKSVKSKVI